MYYNLGCRHLDLGDLERARESFRRCAAEDPEFLEAAVMQARVSLALEDLDAVDAIARNLAPEDVDRDDLRYILGMVALQKGEVGAAERVFAQMGAGRPGEGWGGLGLGLAALARGDAAAAARSLAAAGVRPGSAPEAEAYVRRWLRVRWLRGEDVPAEDELVRVFPALEELRGRYRNLRRAVVAP